MESENARIWKDTLAKLDDIRARLHDLGRTDKVLSRPATMDYIANRFLNALDKQE